MTSDSSQAPGDVFLSKLAKWFEDEIIKPHIQNIAKLSNPQEFNINPFLVRYLATVIGQELTPSSVAQALIYPRALGTSITTSFGTKVQHLITNEMVHAFGSTAAGMDIVFIDRVDGMKRYAQIKLGPETINKDDVKTIDDHFKGLFHLSKTNGNPISKDGFTVGVMFGKDSQLNNFYNTLRDGYGYEVLVGESFWHHLTGDPDFFEKMEQIIATVSTSSPVINAIDNAVSNLSRDPLIIQIASK